MKLNQIKRDSNRELKMSFRNAVPSLHFVVTLVVLGTHFLGVATLEDGIHLGKGTADNNATVSFDLADPRMADHWIVNLAAGEASFDSFVHHPDGPVYVGSGDDPWPVNGFLYGGKLKCAAFYCLLSYFLRIM